MKRHVFLGLILLTLSVYQSSAQYKPSQDQNQPNYEYQPSVYLAFCSGIDNYSGLFGLGLIFPYQDMVSVRGGLGLGVWGAKISGGLKYEDMFEDGWGIGLSYSYCTGIEDFDAPLLDEYGEETEVNMDLKPVGTINVTINRNWVFRGNKIFYLETGYAISTNPNNYYRINDGSVLTDDSELVMQIIRPGGLIMAAGFNIGF